MPVSVGMRFGRYELLSQLGAGAMGEVYRARDLDLGRDVAVKFLPERLASDPDRLGRFEQEARAASSLNHPNIVTIHEVGEAEGLPYIVMELVEGETLRDLMARGPVDAKRTIDIASQVADGLAKAHAAGIVHRDIKPENVMLTRDRFVKILDFGLAKLRGAAPSEPSHSEYPTLPGASSPQTISGVVLGTVGYMSPEQAAGRSIDFRSDQFALGVILYEMLSGRRPFCRESPVQTMVSIIEDEPEPLPALVPHVPAALCWIVERCLAKGPEERWASTSQLAGELRAIRERLGSASGHPGTAPAAAPRHAGVVRRAAFAACAAAALLAGGAALSPSARERAALALHLRAVPKVKRLAILPFRAADGSTEDRALADGIPDLLAVRLTQLERFQQLFSVESMSNVRRTGVGSADLAAGALGANLVIAGTVRRLGGRLLLTATLEDARDGRTLRAESAGSTDELLDRALRMLELEVAPEARAELNAAGTNVAEAATLSAEAFGYTPWAEGKSALERYDQARSLERSIELFNKSLERDPRYALAHAGLAEAYWRLYLAEKKPEYVPLAREHATRATQLDPLLSGAWSVLGMIEAGTGRAKESIEAFDKAIARDPRGAAARREYGLALQTLGRYDEAEAAYRKAIELRPDYWAGYSYLGFLQLVRGRCADSEKTYRRALELAPENARVWSSLGAARACLGKGTEALAAFERSIAIHPTPQAISNVATLQFQQKRYAEAARTLQRAIDGGTRDYRVWRNYAAALYWAPGERGRSKDAYARAAALAEQERKIRAADRQIVIELADCYAMMGEAQRARSAAAEALRTEPVDGTVAFLAGGVYEQIGDREEAIRWLSRALKAGYPPADIDSDPTFEQLRTDRRWAALRSG